MTGMILHRVRPYKNQGHVPRMTGMILQMLSFFLIPVNVPRMTGMIPNNTPTDSYLRNVPRMTGMILKKIKAYDKKTGCSPHDGDDPRTYLKKLSKFLCSPHDGDDPIGTQIFWLKNRHSF